MLTTNSQILVSSALFYGKRINYCSITDHQIIIIHNNAFGFKGIISGIVRKKQNKKPKKIHLLKLIKSRYIHQSNVYFYIKLYADYNVLKTIFCRNI